ncbi:histidinol-phosphatase HisJ [Paenibacillus sp. LHD-38]|uniref:histidinol-phosphatase HisJ n=1 Tax=Paenibacillus sp. LHD-38 TaxID=3072143 RepID=UPI00280F4138|nr:histidinol-phosphatase HisJ [Paenibacillus sp. LHD-38]MDQ8734712.1 histidinol-phosphatase HisJ [Paenibacillus sp. LHD-38]
MPLKWDAHTHTNFCKHGSDSGMRLYVEEAIKQGFQRYSITEHPPLPEGWIFNRQLFKELAMESFELPHYLRQAYETKERFEGRIEVAVGLELDYLDGAPDFMLGVIDSCERTLEDVVVSVHFLPGVGGIRCIDYTIQDFREGLLGHYVTLAAVVDEYYNHVEAAIEFAKQLPMRKRIGHINLIEKFRLELPEFDEDQIRKRLSAILPQLEKAGVGIDVNTAGFRKATCGKTYVPEWFLQQCVRRGIEVVYGSDAHSSRDVGAGWDWYEQAMLQAAK